MCMNRRELTSIIACLGGTSYWYIKISCLIYYYMPISYFLDSVVYCLVKRCLIPLIITSMILLLRKFHPRGEESSVMNYFIAFRANRKWSNLFDITHCDSERVDGDYMYTGPNQTWEIGRKKITTEYKKLLSLICFVNEKLSPIFFWITLCN